MTANRARGTSEEWPTYGSPKLGKMGEMGVRYGYATTVRQIVIGIRSTFS
jgi:hypothetical protein